MEEKLKELYMLYVYGGVRCKYCVMSESNQMVLDSYTKFYFATSLELAKAPI